jgi:hypothetical protein
MEKPLWDKLHTKLFHYDATPTLIDWGSEEMYLRDIQVIGSTDVRKCWAFKSEHTLSFLPKPFFEFAFVVREIAGGYFHIHW